MSSREVTVPRDGHTPFRPHHALHRLAVTADPETNLLLRLLEPFVIHDVLPSRLDCSAGETLTVTIEFAAEDAVAVRLSQRLGVMVGVRAAVLLTAAGEAAQMRAA